MPAVLKHNCKCSLLNIYFKWNSAISIHGFWRRQMCHFIGVFFESVPSQQGPCMCMWGSPVLRQPEKLHFRHWRGSETSPAVEKTVHKHLYPWWHQTLAWQGGISASTCLITMVISEKVIAFCGSWSNKTVKRNILWSLRFRRMHLQSAANVYTSIHFGSCLRKKSWKKS